MDNTNEINNNAEKLLMAVRQTVMVTNLSLAGALETSFQAMYEKKGGILFMGIRADSTAVLIATGEGSNSIIQLNVVLGKDCFGERKSIYKLETHEETIQVWQKLRDKVYEWSDGEIEKVELD